MDFSDFIYIVGFVIFSVFLIKLANFFKLLLYPHIFPTIFGIRKDLTKYGTWAVVTGSTDGIGKGYAKALAHRGLNLVLISRSSEKLSRTREEISEKHAKIEIKTVVFDFSTGDVSRYDVIRESLKNLDIGILVNNVGMAYEYPEYFLNYADGEKFHQTMLNVNCLSVAQMTHMILPKMIARKNGAIVTLASALGMRATALAAVYSATKGYVSLLMRNLRLEYADSGVTFQSIYPAYVATKMTRLQPSNLFMSFFVPDPDTYARYALNTLGYENETFGCFSHTLHV